MAVNALDGGITVSYGPDEHMLTRDQGTEHEPAR
jgi:hypothetical protein